MLSYPPRLLIGKKLFVKINANVPLFDYTITKVKGYAQSGQYVGTISDFEVKDGLIYWRFNNASAALFKYVPFFVMNDPGVIRFDSKEISLISKEDVKREKAHIESAKKDILADSDYRRKGFFRFYFEKYMPYILIGSGLIFFLKKK